ncbi:MAG: heavy metal translocating P-type ATPase metal-binding domain-containing protein [Bacteroidales bacterium]|nr:heavy metal translocating P-type ATPase metal-binding domain-containing protein [Bacteroidales bacterium]
MPKKSGLPCYHCGEDCGKYPVMYNEKPFCCNGCKTVYDILSDGDACEYYNIDQHPGVRSIVSEIGNKYAYLENKEIINNILDFSDGGVNKVKFFVPSIHCSSCIWLLENLDRLNKGIVYSMVNFVKKEVTITIKEKDISLRGVVELMASLNYIPQITIRNEEEKIKHKASRRIIYKLGVAGFFFGNIMLLSLPAYLDTNNIIDKELELLFRWLSLAFSLPVVFYAASDYFISAIKGLRKKIINIDVPIAMGITTLFVRSVWEVTTQTGGGYFDSMAGLVFFLLIGKWYQSKTYQALSFERDYKSYFPVAVTVLNEHQEEISVPLKKIKIGDRILVRNKELIPADAILLDGNASIDYSFVSGESTPVAKRKKDLIYAGGRQIGSSIELMVEKEVAQSYLTELWNQDIHTQDKGSRLDSLVDSISRYFTFVVILVSLAAGITWLFIDPAVALNAFTSVLIVACPCALALTLPFTFGSTMRIFGKNGFYLKKAEIIERLSKINTIVFDKTGTITQNDAFKIDKSNLKADKDVLKVIKSLVRHSTHPMSVAIYLSIKDEKMFAVDKFEEIPAQGIKGEIEGKAVRLGSEKFVTGTDSINKDQSTRVFCSLNEKPIGYFLIKNRYRKGLTSIISTLRKKYELHLLSGDNASELPNLLPLFKEKNNLHFRQSPKDKLDYVGHLKKDGKSVLMTGDGLNDAGALKESDVGITVADDIYHFSPACDGILEAKKFNRLTAFIGFTKTSMRIVVISFVISFLYNIIGLFFAVNGYLTPVIAAILMPISSVSVVAFATFTTIFFAKRKGFVV